MVLEGGGRNFVKGWRDEAEWKGGRAWSSVKGEKDLHISVKGERDGALCM